MNDLRPIASILGFLVFMTVVRAVPRLYHSLTSPSEEVSAGYNAQADLMGHCQVLLRWEHQAPHWVDQPWPDDEAIQQSNLHSVDDFCASMERATNALGSILPTRDDTQAARAELLAANSQMIQGCYEAQLALARAPDAPPRGTLRALRTIVASERDLCQRLTYDGLLTPSPDGRPTGLLRATLGRE